MCHPNNVEYETFTYNYDANGNVASVTGSDGPSTYINDNLDRLIDDKPATSSQRGYGYDRNGNRTSMQNNGITNGYDYLSNSSVLDTDNNGLVSHDASGNRTSDRGGLRTYDYNNAGRLWKVYEAGTLVVTYTYNALGQRTRKTTAQGTTIYHYDLAGKVIAETSQTGAAKRDYVYMGNIPVAQIDKTTIDNVVYLHTDHLGTPRRATNQQGMVVWSWDGDAFGQTAANNNPLNTGSSTIVNLRFAGQYFDDETGLHYNYFRYYDPSSGRYVTSDPIGLDGGLNTFGYVGGNPLRFIDPFGLECNASGCWLTPSEASSANSGNYLNYYNAACAGGDTYACSAHQVAENSGLLAAITNWRLENSLEENGNSESQCKTKMEDIRIDLAKAHAAALFGATPENPRVLSRTQISEFHNRIFSQHGAGPVFGGDIPVFGNWPFTWCSYPSCQP